MPVSKWVDRAHDQFVPQRVNKPPIHLSCRRGHLSLIWILRATQIALTKELLALATDRGMYMQTFIVEKDANREGLSWSQRWRISSQCEPPSPHVISLHERNDLS